MTMAQANGLAGDTRGPVDQRLTAEIEAFARRWASRSTRRFCGGRTQRRRADDSERREAEADRRVDAGRGARFRAAAQLSRDGGDAQFFAVAERFKIASVTELPSLAALKQLVEELESLANQQVA